TPHEVTLVLGAQHAAAERDLGAEGGDRVGAIPRAADGHPTMMTTTGPLGQLRRRDLGHRDARHRSGAALRWPSTLRSEEGMPATAAEATREHPAPADAEPEHTVPTDRDL